MSYAQPTSTTDDSTPSVGPGNYSPVTVYMEDTMSAIFLGIFALVFLVGWMRSETRYRKLMIHKEITGGSNSFVAR